MDRIKVITIRDHIKSVAQRWKYVHGRSEWTMRAFEIYTRLLELDLETCTEKDVEEAIGENDGYSNLICFGCDTENIEAVANIVIKGHSEGYPLCFDCLEDAIHDFRLKGGRVRNG